MAIELPDARELTDEALRVLRLRACAVWNWAIPKLTWPTSWASARRPSAAGGPPTHADGIDCLPGGRTGRPQGTGRLLSDSQADRIKGLIDDNSSRNWASTTPVDSPRRPRADPQGVPHRPGGAPGRPVPASLGLHVQEARAPCPQARSRRDRGVVARGLPGHRSAAAQEDAEILWTDEVGVEADHHPGSGYARGGASDHGSAGAAHPGEPDLGDQQRGHAAAS